jgi:chromosome partitioning protein
MRTILVANRKGGSGKTTLATHLGVGLCQQAAKFGNSPELAAVLVDTDPQGSLAAWWEDREKDWPALLHTDLRHLPARLRELDRAGVETVVVDSFPASTPEGMEIVQGLVQLADAVAIPVRTSVLDLRAAAATVWMCRDAGVPAFFVLSQVNRTSNAYRDVWTVLEREFPREDFPELTTCPYPLSGRIAFADAMAEGGTVFEFDEADRGRPARNEIKRVVEWVRERYIRSGKLSATQQEMLKR